MARAVVTGGAGVVRARAWSVLAAMDALLRDPGAACARWPGPMHGAGPVLMLVGLAALLVLAADAKRAGVAALSAGGGAPFARRRSRVPDAADAAPTGSSTIALLLGLAKRRCTHRRSSGCTRPASGRTAAALPSRWMTFMPLTTTTGGDADRRSPPSRVSPVACDTLSKQDRVMPLLLGSVGRGGHAPGEGRHGSGVPGRVGRHHVHRGLLCCSRSVLDCRARIFWHDGR